MRGWLRSLVGGCQTRLVDTPDEPKPLLRGRSLLLLEDFCRASGLDPATVSALVRSGTVEGLFHLDGRVAGLFDDVLPTVADLRSMGFVIRDDYDPDLLRSYTMEDDEDDDGLDDGDSSWSISWGDGPRHLRISVPGAE